MDKKAELLEAIAGKNRGLLASDLDKINVLTIVEQLEDHNPTVNPLSAKDKLNGNWRLLYTTSKSLLGIDRVPVVKLGQIYQYISVRNSQIYNIAEIMGLPLLESLIVVTANFTSVSHKRIKVNFERSIVGLQRFLNYQSPSQFISQIEGGKSFFPIDFKINNGDNNPWLEITYLDDDLRISRGNEGNVFILAKNI
jgi:hypothetical protein